MSVINHIYEQTLGGKWLKWPSSFAHRRLNSDVLITDNSSSLHGIFGP
jgi:hypothetical protein